MNALFNRGLHCSNRVCKSDKDRLTDEKVPDVQFPYRGNRGDSLDIGKVEAVAGMAFEADSSRMRCRPRQSREFIRRAAGEPMPLGSGVKFDDRRTKANGRIELREVGVDK